VLFILCLDQLGVIFMLSSSLGHTLGGLMEQTLILIYFMLIMSYKNTMLV
jgi:hypothetical protein